MVSVNNVAAANWCGFKEVYVGMPLDNAMSNGFNQCTPSDSVTDSTCHVNFTETPQLSTIANLQIEDIDIGVRKGLVATIGLYIKNTNISALLKYMRHTYGKYQSIKKEGYSETYNWQKNSENIILIKDSDHIHVRFSNDNLLTN
jgi:hypothetical protein